MPIAVRTASKSRPALGRLLMPDLRHPDCWDPPTIYHHLAPFPNAGNGTKANSCQQFVVMFNKDASGVSALQHFRKIELKATFRPWECPISPTPYVLRAIYSTQTLHATSVPFGILGEGPGLFLRRSDRERCCGPALAS